MNRQSKNRTLIIIFSLLLLINIGLLSYFIFFKESNHKPYGKRGGYLSEYLKKELNFNEAQLVQYDSLRARHIRQVKVLYDSIRLNKQKKFKQMGKSGFADSSLTQAVQFAANQQKMVELEMLLFLKQTRNLGNAEQRIKFDSSFYKVMMRSHNKSKSTTKKE